MRVFVRQKSGHIRSTHTIIKKNNLIYLLQNTKVEIMQKKNEKWLTHCTFGFY